MKSDQSDEFLCQSLPARTFVMNNGENMAKVITVKKAHMTSKFLICAQWYADSCCNLVIGSCRNVISLTLLHRFEENVGHNVFFTRFNPEYGDVSPPSTNIKSIPIFVNRVDKCFHKFRQCSNIAVIYYSLYLYFRFSRLFTVFWINRGAWNWRKNYRMRLN